MTVGFFMPLPLAVMIPFMAGQSFAMGEAFGKGFQYGKRRISAMTNEEFNAMSAKDHFSETTADISAMIPSMKAQMNNFSTLQTDIIKTLIEQLKDAGITIGEALTTAGSEVFTEGPTGGTELAQSSLDQLRGLVGLPPQYSKLVSPAGINALIKFWNDAALLSSLKLALNPTTWIFNEIKKIFNQNPPANTVTTIFKWIQDNTNTLTGPPVPPGGIQDPSTVQQPNTIVVNADGSITNLDTRGGVPGTLKAPSSIITQFNKWNAEIRALWTQIDDWRASNASKNEGNILKAFARIEDINKLGRDLWRKYDLVGKVNDSWFKTHLF